MDELASRGRLGDFLSGLGSGTERLRFPPVGVTPAVTAVAVLAGAVGAAAAWGAPSGRALAPLVGLGLGAAAVVAAVGLAILVLDGLRPPGIAHLAYLGGVVSIPMVGVAVAVDGALAAGALLMLPAALGWYATHVEPHWLRVDRATVALRAGRAGADPVRIAVLADLQTNHVGPDEQRAIDRILAEAPDVVLIAGDLLQGTDGPFAEAEADMRALLGRLHAPGGVYCVRGDCDPGDRVDRLVRGSGIRILDDEWVDVRIGDRCVRLGGNRLEYAAPPAVALRRSLEADETPGDGDGVIRILLAHRPDAVLDLVPGSAVDLTVAGHTHGGQIVVPGFGPLLTYTRVPRSVAAGGLHELSGNRIYVSTGVGRERMQAPQVRLFCRPSIGILTLR